MEHVDTILPEDFDGVFRFTNASEEDFIAKWDSKEYLFPARKTTPMVMAGSSPIEVQSIRKKFAKDWAVNEFLKGSKGVVLQSQEKNSDGTARFGSIHMAATYSESDLVPYIQMCLEPLPQGKVKVSVAKKEPLEDKLSRDDDGNIITEVLDRDKKTSLRKRVLES